MSFQMPPKPTFSTADSIQIVGLWYKMKDLDKVSWRYAKEKGIEHFPRKLLNKRSFKSVIDRFQKKGSVHIQNREYKKP